jgi:anti-sigma factor RsiW
MKDPDFATKSAASLLGDLSPEEQAAWNDLIQHDPEARARHEEFAAMNNLLQSHIAAAAPAPDFEQRVVGGFRRRVRRESLLARLSRLIRLPVVYIPAAAAVLVALVQVGSMLTGERATGYSVRKVVLTSGPPDSSDGSVEHHSVHMVGTGNAGAMANREWAEADKRLAFQSGSIQVAQAPAPAAAPKAEEPAQVQQLAAIDNARSERMKEDLAANKPEAGENGVRQLESGMQWKEAKAQPSSTAIAGVTVAAAAPVDVRKLIRNASVDIEVHSFDEAAQKAVTLADAAGGYVATRNSARLPNGKMSGTLVVKVPPAALDGFLQQLRGLGEIRNLSLGSQDVTKEYFDTDARLRNARRMEDGLLDLLKNTKSRVSDLLQVERELGRVRGEIEGMQGQLKLWDSLVAYATVTIRLSEKNMDEATAYLLREQATLSLASTDVEKTYQQASAVAASAKAQVVQSNVTHDGNGRATAVLSLLLDSNVADATIAQLKGLGRVLDYHSETERVARDGSADATNARVERDRVQVTLSITSQDETPAQRTQLRIETPQVESAIGSIRTFLADQGAKIEDSSFAQLGDGGQTASLRVSFPLASYPTILARFQQAGAVKDLTVQRDDSGQPGTVSARAEINAQFSTPTKLVSSNDSLLATLRRTFSQAVGALMWSLRMIGVAVAFFAPWLAAVAGLWLVVRLLRRGRK